MGAGDDSAPTEPAKATSSTQEVPATPSYSDWSNSMMAYYGAGATPPPPFFASAVPSPSPHPYMWGGQHTIIPPYGTPVPYPALYPSGGVYAHPSMPMTLNTGQPNVDVEAKASNGKDRTSKRKSKGNSGNAKLIDSKVGESGNGASGSGNDGPSPSDESGSEGSSDASDENQQDLTSSRKKSFGQMLVDGANAQHSTAGADFPSLAPWKPVVNMPPSNLNMGMDLWNAVGAGVGPVKDERELKREKRKQSNRESARRSRLRKQAECEELQTRVEALNNENLSLREELQRLAEECKKLISENSSIKVCRYSLKQDTDKVDAPIQVGNTSKNIETINVRENFLNLQ